jgi:TPR repeat protein
MCIKKGALGSGQPACSARWIAIPADAARIRATKEQTMTEKTGGRELLFLMTAEQAQAFAWLVAAANRGDGAAACRLGDMCREGLGGLRFSPKQTYRWYAKSALAGDANGQNNLGACYEHGLGCTQSYVKAVKWYRLAAAQGLAYASSNLGYCYLRGHGVAMDKGEALAWFERALEQGDDRAKAMVEKLGGAVPPKRKVRIVDKTVPGKNFGIVGIGGVARPGGDASESGDTEDSQ